MINEIINEKNKNIVEFIFRIIADEAINGIMITDLEGNILWVNKSFEENTGYKLNEVFNKNPRILKSGLTKKEEYKKLWDSIINNGYFEGSIYNKDKNNKIYKQNVKIWRIEKYFIAIIDYKERLNKIEKEIKTQFYLAQKIQERILPKTINTENIKIDYIYKSLNEIGGDIIEILKIDEHKIGVLVGDISGHGIPAAMIQIMIKTIVKEFREYEDIEGLLLDINKKILELDVDMFLTCFYGVFNTKNMTLEYVNCAHPYPILIDENNNLQVLEEKNSPILGLFDSPNIIKMKISISKNQKFIINTDGVLEAINIKNEEFKEYLPGILKDILEKNYSIHSIIKNIDIFLSLHTVGSEQEDDYSILGVEVL